MATSPRTPRTMRTTSTFSSSSLSGMKSMSATAPRSVSNVVSMTAVSGKYRRVLRTTAPSGASNQRPCSGPPSSAAKHAGESNRGRHSQSMEPSLPTRAADSMLPIRP